MLREIQNAENVEPIIQASTQAVSNAESFSDIEYLEEAFMMSEELNNPKETGAPSENDESEVYGDQLKNSCISQTSQNSSKQSDAAGGSDCSQCVLNETQKHQYQR